jgi:WD40 repeat protein
VLLNNLPQAKLAAYNAKSHAGRRSCTAKTREKILADLVAWALDAGDTSIYWLNGMAGTGKTTIAFTFSQFLDNIEILGSSFFCSHLDTDSSNADLIFPTLAYELARHSTAASTALLNALEEDPNVGHKSMRDQFLNLIVTPTKAASEGVSTPPRPLIIVIDALDECANQNDVRDVLTIIRQYSPILPLKFFITSRPERQIQNVFRQEGTSRYSKFILHEIEKDVVSADIAIYAREELATIAKRRIARLPTSGWPPEDRLNTLVRLSGTLFIYAATACKYVGGGGSIVERLEDVTDISPNSPNSPNSETSALDDLYGRILSDAFQVANAREKGEIQKVLRAVVSVRTPLSINGLSKLLKIKAENVSEALSFLHSIICIPEDTDLPMSTFHASFTDFITTEKRSGGHFLEPSKSHHMLGLHCLGLLQSSLVENICQLEGLSVSNVDVSPSTVKDRIPEAIEYACINWASHVANIKSGGEVGREVRDALYLFFDEKLLQWFECLSLLARLGDAVSSLRRLEAWVSVCSFSIPMRSMAEQQMKSEHNLQNAVVDARRFILENFDLVSHHPCETYSSALVWIPEKSRIRAIYGDKRKSVWKVDIGLRKVWDACEQVLWGHSGCILSVALSPDGSHVVSGSSDSTVHIWNVATGESEAELKGHSDSVNSVVFSPDGSLVVSGSRDQTVRIWNVLTGECQAELKGHSNWVNSIVFSPDGSLVASGSLDKTVCIWNVETGECEAELKGHSNWVNSVVFSPDGSLIASGSLDKTVCIWNVETGECEAQLKGHLSEVNCAVFSPDGSLVVSGSDDKTACIWNVATGECKAELKGHSDWVNSVVFSPDGSFVMSASDDKTVRIWNVATGESEAELKGHSSEVNCAVFSPDGTLVGSGSNDKTVRIWNMVTGEFEAELKGHSDIVTSVIFSPDGSHVMSGSEDKTVHIWNVMPLMGESEEELKRHSGSVTSVNYSPDGSRVVSGSQDKIVRIWNVVTGESEAELKGHSNCVNYVVFSHDGHLVASGSDDKTVRVWNVATGESEAELKGHSDKVTSVIFPQASDSSCILFRSRDKTVRMWNVVTGQSEELKGHLLKVNSVVFSPDGNLVVSGSDDETVHIWNVVTGECEAELKGHLNSVNSVAFSPDGSLVASGSRDRTVRIWNVATGDSEAELKGHSGCVVSVVFSPDGSLVASGSQDKSVYIWNVVTGECEAELKGHSDCVNSVVFSPDGSLVVSGSDDKTVRIWNMVTGESEAELKGHSNCVKSIVFSPDGSYVVSGSSDATVRIWNVATGESEAELKGHSDSVTSVIFSPDGGHVVSGSQDKTVRIWNVVTGKSEEELMGHSGNVNCVNFSPDGSYVASGSADRTIRIWNIVTGDFSVLANYALQQYGIYYDHQNSPESFHIFPYLPLTGTRSFHLDSPWIVHTGSGLKCWLPPQYRNIQTTTSYTTLFCIGLQSGLVLAGRFCSDPFKAVVS